MRNFEIFYHVAIMQSWTVSHDIIFDHINQTDILNRCSKFYYCINGSLEEFYSKVHVPNDPKFIVVQLSHTPDKFEFPTINFLRKQCLEATENIDVLYMHTKGASQPVDRRNGRSNHLDQMTFNCIRHYEECQSKLSEGYDACGLALCEEPFLHYSGNIWWSKSEHTKKLIHLENGIRNFNDVDHPDRHDAEKWLGSVKGNFYGLNYQYNDSKYLGYTYAHDAEPSLNYDTEDIHSLIKHSLVETVGLDTNLFKDICALESGGSSDVFQDLGVYQNLSCCDNINFTNEVWLLNKPAGEYRYCKKLKGKAFWADATDLRIFADNSYDIMLSSDNLEHIANPLKALYEWRRVIKNQGYIFLVLPKKESNFDHKRSVTKFSHLLDDLTNNVTETDMTHLEEILELHDLDRDPCAKPFEWFKERSIDNIKHRCLHHHVFDKFLIKEIFDFMNFDTILITNTENSYFALARVNK